MDCKDHVLQLCGTERWVGYGKDIPRSIKFLLRGYTINSDYNYLKLRIDALECRNCNHAMVTIVARDDRREFPVIIHEFETFDLEAAK